VLGLFSGLNGCEVTDRRQGSVERLAMVPMLPIYVHLNSAGRMDLLLILNSGESGGVMPCLTGTPMV